MKQKFFRVLNLLFFLFIGLFLIWLVIKDLSENDKQEIFIAFYNANYFWVAITLVFSVLSNISRAIRWNMLIQPLGYQPKLKNTFCAIIIGYLANYALPRMGEVTRCGILTKYEKVPLNESLGTVVAERVIDVISLIIIFFFTIFIQFDLLYKYAESMVITPIIRKLQGIGGSTIVIVFVLGLLLVSILIYYFRKSILNLKIFKVFKDLIKGFVSGLKTVKSLSNPMGFVMHTVFIWLMYYLMIHVGFYVFKDTSTLNYLPAFSILVFGSLGMIAVQGGIGAYPLIVMETLALYGVPKTAGFAFGWMAWGSQAVLFLIGGFTALILLPILNKSKVYVTPSKHKSENLYS